MWDEPYLETCCRSALHRLFLAGEAGRPVTATDKPCLHRLQVQGFAKLQENGNVTATDAGRSRHAQEILRSGGPRSRAG